MCYTKKVFLKREIFSKSGSLSYRRIFILRRKLFFFFFIYLWITTYFFQLRYVHNIWKCNQIATSLDVFWWSKYPL